MFNLGLQEKQATLKEELEWHVEQRARDRGAAAAIKPPGAEQQQQQAGPARLASPGEAFSLVGSMHHCANQACIL